MAERSKGRFVRLSDFAKLGETLKVAGEPKVEVRPVHEDLSADWEWPAVILAILMLSIEWAIRKRKGLV
jgi:hypothetical protein